MKFIVEQNNGVHCDIFLHTYYELWDCIVSIIPIPSSHLSLPPQIVLLSQIKMKNTYGICLSESGLFHDGLQFCLSSCRWRDFVLYDQVTLHYHLLDFWCHQEEAVMPLFGQRLEDPKNGWMCRSGQLCRWNTGRSYFSQSISQSTPQSRETEQEEYCSSMVLPCFLPCQQMLMRLP